MVMARVGFSSLNVNQMAGNKGMIAVCLRSRQQERSRNGPLDLVETHNNEQLQRQQRAVPFFQKNRIATSQFKSFELAVVVSQYVWVIFTCLLPAVGKGCGDFIFLFMLTLSSSTHPSSHRPSFMFYSLSSC